MPGCTYVEKLAAQSGEPASTVMEIPHFARDTIRSSQRRL